MRLQLTARAARIENDLVRCMLWTIVFLVDALIPKVLIGMTTGTVWSNTFWFHVKRAYLIGIDGTLVGEKMR